AGGLAADPEPRPQGDGPAGPRVRGALRDRPRRRRRGVTVAAARITDAVRVQVPLVRPFVWSSGTITERDAWIVRLEAPDGRVGHGEAGLDPGADAAARDRLAAAIRAAVDRGTFDPERASTDPADAAV